jgi:hypothetical protein
MQNLLLLSDQNEKLFKKKAAGEVDDVTDFVNPSQTILTAVTIGTDKPPALESFERLTQMMLQDAGLPNAALSPSRSAGTPRPPVRGAERRR